MRGEARLRTGDRRRGRWPLRLAPDPLLETSAGSAPDAPATRAVAGVFHRIPTPMPPPRVTRENESIFWATPSSKTAKSSLVRSVTGAPPRWSRTTTSTRIAVVADVSACLSADAEVWATSCSADQPSATAVTATTSGLTMAPPIQWTWKWPGEHPLTRASELLGYPDHYRAVHLVRSLLHNGAQFVGARRESVKRQASNLLNAARTVGRVER